MLTFEKVLEVFQAYLDDDPLYEVVQTSHGYTLMAWEPHRNDWYSAEIQKTPEDLRNALLDTYANFLEDKITGSDRELTVTETRDIQQRCRELWEDVYKRQSIYSFRSWAFRRAVSIESSRSFPVTSPLCGASRYPSRVVRGVRTSWERLVISWRLVSSVCRTVERCV